MIEIFYLVNEFTINFRNPTQPFILGNAPKRPPIMSDSEVISIIIWFRLSGFRYFRRLYKFYVQKYMTVEYPRTVSYNRFTELMQLNLLPLTMFLKTSCMGQCTGISFIDSTCVYQH